MADKRSATREKTRSIATERERDDYVFEWADAPAVFIFDFPRYGGTKAPSFSFKKDLLLLKKK